MHFDGTLARAKDVATFATGDPSDRTSAQPGPARDLLEVDAVSDACRHGVVGVAAV